MHLPGKTELAVGWLLFLGPLCLAADPPKKDGPQVLVVLPLGIAPGSTSRVTVRGLKLDTATAVRFTDSTVTAKVLNKGKAAVPDKEQPARVGDTQVEMEVTLPARATADSGTFVVVTPSGETPPHKLLIETALPVVAEKEPNNGFGQAQPIQLPQVIEGTIAHAQDVDVFRFEGKAGQQVVFEVHAARHGSLLDSVLTLYDAVGHELAANDDAEGSDSRLEFTLPRDGTYYVSLADALDLGGPLHVYRLVARPR